MKDREKLKKLVQIIGDLLNVEGNEWLMDEIFKTMDAAGDATPSEKDNKSISAYFKKVYPKMDFEKVYTSDMKKMIRWFNAIKKNNIEIKVTEMNEEENEEN
jgi:hypothetical protein